MRVLTQALGLFILFSNLVMAMDTTGSSQKQGKIYIEEIQCEGHYRTSCIDLIKLLGLQPKSHLTDDELNALNSKLGQIGYFSEYSVSLAPLAKKRHANLILKIKEKDTGRHGVLSRGVFGFADLPAFGQYSYTDTNFLGKGHYFHGSATANLFFKDTKITKDEDFMKQLKPANSFSLELATPFQNSSVASMRFLTPRYGNHEVIGLLGLGVSTSYNSVVTAYVGNAVGGNLTYTTEDNTFIPKNGVRFSATYLYMYLGLYDEIGVDMRANFQWGRLERYDGVLSLGFISKPHLNPSFYSFEGQNQNTPFQEGGIKYSLVSTEGDRRSAIYGGVSTTEFFNGKSNVIFQVGYKAALESMDIDIGLIMSQDGAQ